MLVGLSMRVRNVFNCRSWHLCHIPSQTNASMKFIICLGFALSMVWIQTVRRPIIIKHIHVEKLTREALINRTHNELTKNIKYLLLWTPVYHEPFNYFGEGQRAFLKNNCPVTNCYVTSNRSFLDGDVTKFHAVAFNGRHLLRAHRYEIKWLLPKKRSMHQKYIYVNMESADNFMFCNKIFDNFFNWTVTYKLNSDIPYPYIAIKNKNAVIVGPRQDMSWENDVVQSEEEPIKLHNKTKAAAWFVSSCNARSNRHQFVKKLQRELARYGYNVDVYGKCGTLQCPRERESDCCNLLEKDYYFYLSLENSFNEDYVTEKVLTAVQNNVVPIVYGGANYSRFLPPGSYLDGRQLTVYDLADTMARLINSPKMYQQYFKWKQHYTYSDPTTIENVCAVCAALNNDTLRNAGSTYKKFRKWWNPYYSKRCKGIFGELW